MARLMAHVMILLLSAAPAWSADTLEQRLLLLAGGAPIDCGSVQIGEDGTAASDCAKRSYSHKRAFIVRYYVQGFDSIIGIGFAGTRAGKVFAAEYDSMGWSSDGLSPRARLLDDRHVLVEPCPVPVLLRATPSHRLSCSREGSKAMVDVLSPIYPN